MYKFKYIPCKGSTEGGRTNMYDEFNLNTSHVKVQPVILLSMSIAIAYLNTSHVKVQHLKTRYNTLQAAFKYIPCKGSTLSLGLLVLLQYNLNTSHVKVQQLYGLKSSTIDIYLNTSHVKVQLS